MRTVLVFGDQLNRRIGALADAEPGSARVLLIESEALLARNRHVQRNHFVVTAMRRFAAELEQAGYAVDLRSAETLRAGIEAHRSEFEPDEIIATEPNSRAGRRLCDDLGIAQARSNQFLCHESDFARWADSQKSMKMESFYRWTRNRQSYLMDGDGEPVEGRWNFDEENREPPPDDPTIFSTPPTSELDDLDRDVLASLPESHGEPPVGIWATSRRAALTRLNHFVEHELARFGPYEDAMTAGSWNLAHSVLSPYLNLGLLMPDEVCERVEEAYRNGDVPINSAEGFIRQVIGWREYVWGLYWLWMPEYRNENRLSAHRAVPPAFTGDASTEMACVRSVVGHVHDRGYAHHIERLMVLGNLALTAGVDPQAMTDWMWANFVDGAEWVMLPNVIGMALHADGGRMATKPYASGGAYINRMSDHCRGCRFDPKRRTGPDACPFTTLYWDFLARNEQAFTGNHRMAQQLAGMRRLADLADVRERAVEVTAALDAGTL
jgi:deoxyribodipyrimidine photolyase-related protein